MSKTKIIVITLAGLLVVTIFILGFFSLKNFKSKFRLPDFSSRQTTNLPSSAGDSTDQSTGTDSKQDTSQSSTQSQQNTNAPASTPKETAETVVTGPGGKPSPMKALAIMDTSSSSEISKIKDLGANTLTIHIPFSTFGNEFSFSRTRNGQAYQYKAKEVLAPLVNEAHRQGLYVELRTILSPESDPKENPNEDDLLNSAVARMEELADFAREYGIWQIDTMSELDTFVHFAYKNIAPRSLGADKYNPYTRRIIEAVKKKYSGRVCMGLNSPLMNSQLQTVPDFSGYDCFSYTYYPMVSDKDLSSFKIDLVASANIAREIANSYGISDVYWEETGVQSENADIPQSFGGVSSWLTGSEDFIKDFWQIVFSNSWELVNGYVVLYDGPPTPLKGTKSEEVIRQWYSK